MTLFEQPIWKVILLIFMMFLSGRPGVAAEQQIVSYAKNFVVISDDPAAASWAAARAEKIRQDILGEFRWRQQWKQPLILRLRFVDKSRTQAELRGVILRKIFSTPPPWLQRGLERYFSDRRDFYPDRLKELRASGKWLDLKTLLGRDRLFSDAQWQDVFDRESACLAWYLKLKHPTILQALRAGKDQKREVLAIEQQWTEWMASSRPLLDPLPEKHGMTLAQCNKVLARCLRVKVRDVSTGQVLAGASVTQIASLEPCCKKDLAKRKLLAQYGELVQLARIDDKRISLAQEYVDCANKILTGQEFFDTFKTLEGRRLENTSHQR